MKDSNKNLLRWIFLFPGSVVGSILATVLLHLMLYFTLANGETISGVDIQPIEHLLYPFVVSISFVLSGYKIAPFQKFRTAIMLSASWVIVFIGIYFFLYTSGQQQGVQIRGMGSLLGALVALYIARWESRRSLESQIKIKPE
ncbi:MAG: hypothetical protein WC787_01175 [Patescibacteria group bacterium]|jgi:hypothetical protein